LTGIEPRNPRARIDVSTIIHKWCKKYEYRKKEFLHAAAMIFSVKNNSSGIAIFPAVWEGHIFMETGRKKIKKK
jgi:hypothetical protein